MTCELEPSPSPVEVCPSRPARRLQVEPRGSLNIPELAYRKKVVQSGAGGPDLSRTYNDGNSAWISHFFVAVNILTKYHGILMDTGLECVNWIKYGGEYPRGG